MRTDQQWRASIDPPSLSVSLVLSPLPLFLTHSLSLFIRRPLIRHDVSIKLQSKREESKSVLCVWRAANYARRQNNEGGSCFPRLPAANYSFSRPCLSPFSTPILINHHCWNCCCIVIRRPMPKRGFWRWNFHRVHHAMRTTQLHNGITDNIEFNKMVI